MEVIEGLRKKIKLCNIISIIGIILIIVCMISEYAVSKLVADKEAAFTIINNIAYFCYVLPFVVMVPLFFKVNLKNKLTTEMKKKEG